jgi:hypothetical protein
MMTANFTRQVCPPSTIETAADDGLSVRLIQDTGDGMNNYLKFVSLYKVIGQPCIPWWYSHAATTDERVVGIFAPRIVPMGFNYLTWGIGHVRTAGADDCTWRLYCSRVLYQGDAVLDTGKLGTVYKTASFTTSSDTHAVPAVDRSCAIIRGDYGRVYLVLTAQNADVATRAALTDFDVWPSIV